MKRSNKIMSAFLGVAVLAASTTGCKKYFENSVASPNNPSTVTPALLLASVEVSTFASFGGQLARQGAVMIQHMAGTEIGSQSIEIANYNITELTNTNEWDAIYTGALMNANIILREHGEGNPYYRGIAKVLIAMNAGLATDLWGDIPLSEAALGQSIDGNPGNLKPKYDTQEEVIQQIQDYLDEAISDLSADLADNKLVPTTDDFIYGGNVEAWKKAAYVLKARYANRLSQRNAAGSATAAIAALANGFGGPADDCNMIFGEGNALNQWFAYEQSRGGYMKVSTTFVDALTAASDPRLTVFVAEDVNGNITGTPPDDVTVTTSSYVGAYYASATSPIPLLSFVEQKFIEAEAQLRAGNAGGAATAHNEAVIASVLQVTGASDPVFEAAYASEDANSISLQKIMYQKWVALFIQVEAFSDWRRTSFPALTPNANGNTPSIPVRFIYPQGERIYNAANFPTGAIGLTDPVWWDN
jgi:hypothetical protein